jgi:Na+/proline symporter
VAFVWNKFTFSAGDLSLFNMSSADTVAFVLLGGLIVLPDPGLWQRVIAGKDTPSVRKGLAWGALPLCVLGAVISVMGLACRQRFPGIQPQEALVLGFSSLLPWGVKEFGMVMLYAVALSSTDTLTFVISSQFTRDLQNYCPRFGGESMRRLTRVFMVLCLAFAAGVAILNQNIIAIGLTYAGVLVALVPVIIGSTYWRLNPDAAFWSLTLGLATVFILLMLDAVTPQNITLCLPVALVALIVLQLVLRQRKSAPESGLYFG